MENQELYYAMIAIITIVIFAIGFNCYWIYKIYHQKASSGQCKNDPEKNNRVQDASKLNILNDELVKENPEVEDHSSSSKEVETVSPIDSKSNTKLEDLEANIENLERITRNMKLEQLVNKMEQQETVKSEVTSHTEDNHKKSDTSATSEPVFKSIPTNVNTGDKIIPTIWKESELMKVHIVKQN